MRFEQRDVTLSNGHVAQVVIALCRAFDVAPLRASPARLAADLTMLSPDIYDEVLEAVPLPRPAQRCAPQQIDGLEVWAERVRLAASLPTRRIDTAATHGRLDHPSGPPVRAFPVAELGYLRDHSRGEPQSALLSNGNFFLMGDEASPLDALGDPIGLVAGDGEILSPPLGGRAAILQLPDRVVFAHLALGDIEVCLPTGEVLAPDDPDVAIVSRHELAAGRTPAQPGVFEIALVQRWAVAAKRGGGMPVPGAGIVLRWPAEPPADTVAALQQGAPVTFRCPPFPSLTAALQAGPALLGGGNALSEQSFWDEGFFGNSGLRHPPMRFPADTHATRAARLAVGLDPAGQLIVAAVAGESSMLAATRPGGVTLAELAEIMAGLGAVSAVNLDGGGSTQMFAGGGGQLLRPGDRRGIPLAAYDRPIPTALMFR